MEISLANVLTSALVVGLCAVIGLVLNQRSQLVRIETLLTGANGDNGLLGDVKALRKRAHDIADDIHGVRGELQAHDFRIDALDRRVGPEDRRQAI